jgi:hypothetical protein
MIMSSSQPRLQGKTLLQKIKTKTPNQKQKQKQKCTRQTSFQTYLSNEWLKTHLKKLN